MYIICFFFSTVGKEAVLRVRRLSERPLSAQHPIDFWWLGQHYLIELIAVFEKPLGMIGITMNLPTFSAFLIGYKLTHLTRRRVWENIPGLCHPIAFQRFVEGAHLYLLDGWVPDEFLTWSYLTTSFECFFNPSSHLEYL